MTRKIIAVLVSATTLLLAACAYYPADGNWEAENAYWQGNYVNEPYYAAGYGYETYQPAYQFGFESYNNYHGRRFEDINDAELRHNWEAGHGRGSRLDWEHARPAARAAFNHAAARNTHTAPSAGHAGFHHG